MKPRLHSSLEHKFVLTLTLGTLCFALVAGLLQFAYSYAQEVERSQANLNAVAATVHSSASIAVFARNEAIATDVIEGLLRNVEILAVRLESNDGYQIIRWRDPSNPNWQAGNELHYILNSPTLRPAPIGKLSILTNAALIGEHARNAAFMQVLALIGQTTVLALLTMITFRRLIGRPLSSLGRQLLAVQPGTRQRVSIPDEQSHSEIGLLADSVNSYLSASDEAIAAERELRKRVESMEEHYRRIFESASVGVMVLEMDGTLINCNAVLRNRILKANVAFEPGNDEKAKHGFLSVAFKYPERAWALVERAKASGQMAAADLELHELNGQSHWVHCLFSVNKFSNSNFHFIEGVLYDVTSRREREEMALRTAERDPLTDIVNRRGAESYIDRALADARENNVGVTLLFLDLDGFKAVNDRHGHSAGDLVLLEVSARLGGLLRRSSDLVARMGGDEFIIAAYDCSKRDEAVAELAQSVIEMLRRPIRLDDGTEVSVGASVGVASFPEDGNHRRALILAADQAMYEAKHQGRNRIAYAGSEARYLQNKALPPQV